MVGQLVIVGTLVIVGEVEHFARVGVRKRTIAVTDDLARGRKRLGNVVIRRLQPPGSLFPCIKNVPRDEVQLSAQTRRVGEEAER